MTHRSQAPDRIWACPEGGTWDAESGSWDLGRDWQGPEAEYIRADLVPDWKPIETAPKDGSEILGYVGSGYVGGAIVLHALNDGDTWHDWDAYAWEPTHWMPLPKPPKDTT